MYVQEHYLMHKNIRQRKTTKKEKEKEQRKKKRKATNYKGES